MDNMETRVSVLETKVIANTIKIDETQDMIMKFFEKLDDHITEENQHDIELQKGMVKVTDAVIHLTDELTHTNSTLSEIGLIAKTNNLQLVKIDSAWSTVLKLSAIFVTVIAALWGVYHFTIDHSEVVEQIISKIVK